ncbi:hypothetical protein [Pontibacter roseus]|uniref:hypothetical protein n=1 Tax=Pontibacter roseus TaxID=336989 RepID=UPI00036492F5|nr:hypothetical protein [Pontibacter roseus]
MKLNLLLRGALAITLLYLVSCQPNSGTEAETPEESAIETQQATDSVAQPDAAPAPKSTLEMLQGKWRHIEDTTNLLVFENNIRKEFAAGMEAWQEEPFVLSDKCQNETDKGRGMEEGIRYLSVPESDLCWLVDEVSETSLVLLYLGSGNMLMYTRVNE